MEVGDAEASLVAASFSACLISADGLMRGFPDEAVSSRKCERFEFLAQLLL